MADRNGGIKIEGLEEVLKNFDDASEAVIQSALVGLEKGGMEIVAAAQDNLRNNGSVVTGLLRGSGNVERKEDEVTAGFFDTSNRGQGYAEYVEFGRRSGRMPPPEDLAAYAYKKFHLRDWKVARSMGWAMARKIAENGTQPHPFFIPAVNAKTKGTGIGGVVSDVAEAIRRLLRKSTANYATEARRIRYSHPNK